jgi:Uma2 family endonuclease
MLEFGSGSLAICMVQQLSSPPTPALGERRLTLRHISWDAYSQMLNALGDRRAVRLHYCQGTLELMVPLEIHEQSSDLVGVFIRALAFGAGLTIKGLASTTLRFRNLERGAEPDKCYYLQNEPLVRGRPVNLDNDPPPDLVVEIDITHTDLDKNLLYSAMGIPELWRFDGQTLRIFHLEGGFYQSSPISYAFPWMTAGIFEDFLGQCQELGETQAYHNLNTWIQQHCPR